MSDNEIPILTDNIPILTHDDLVPLPGRGMFADDAEASLRRTSVALDIVQQKIRSVLRNTAVALGPSNLDGTDWRISEVKVGLAVEANGEVSLLAVKGKAGSRATLEVTLRLA